MLLELIICKYKGWMLWNFRIKLNWMCQDTQCLIMRETILLGLQPLYDVGTLSLLASHACQRGFRACPWVDLVSFVFPKRIRFWWITMDLPFLAYIILLRLCLILLRFHSKVHGVAVHSLKFSQVNNSNAGKQHFKITSFPFGGNFVSVFGMMDKEGRFHLQSWT